MQLVESAVETIVALLHRRLNEPRRGVWQKGFGGWGYKLTPVGGVKPPYAAGLRLWWLQHEEAGFMLFVAPLAGYRTWKWQGAPKAIRWRSACRPRGDLPLIFATRRTPVDSIKVQAGVMLHRQGWRDDGFVGWLLEWVRLRSSEEAAGDIAMRLLQRYNPATCSPSAYVKLWARKSLPRPTTVEKLAAEVGMSERGLYKALERHGAVEEFVSTGGRVRRRYELAPGVLEAVRREREERQKRRYLVELVMLRRGVGRRAAQRWVKRRIESGMAVEEIALEVMAETAMKNREGPQSE